MADWNEFRRELEDGVTPPPLDRLRAKRRQRQQRRTIAATCAVAMVGTAGFVAVLGRGAERAGTGPDGTPVALPTRLSQVVNSDTLPPPKDYEQPVVTDVDFVSPTTGWAIGLRCVGDACDVSTWRTDDGGRTWSAPTAVASSVPRTSFHAEDPAGGAVRALRMVDERHGFAFNPDLYVTDDGARTWRRVPRPSKVASVSVTDTSYWLFERGCAAGVDCDAVLRAGTVGSPALRDLPVPATRGAAAVVRRAGATDGYVAMWDAPAFPYAAFHVTRDAGRTWATRELPCPQATAVSLSAGAGRPLWLVCTEPRGRTAYQSSDHGTTWERLQAPPGDGVVTDLIARSADHAYLTTQEPGQLLVTTDGGATWQAAAGSGKGYGYGNLDVPDAAHAFAMGDAGLLWRTTDGQTWERLALPPVAPRAAPAPAGTPPPVPRGLRAPEGTTFTSLSFPDARTGWALGSRCARERCRPVLRRTLDGGVTWTEAGVPRDAEWSETDLASPEGRVTRVTFADARHGWLYGPNLFGTRDGGLTWRRLRQDKVLDVQVTGDVVWAAVYQGCAGTPCYGGILRGRVGGTDLPIAPGQPDVGRLPGSLFALDARTAYFLDNYDGADPGDPVLAGTHDGGRTWASRAAPCRYSYRSVSAYASGRLWVLCGTETGQGDIDGGPQHLARSDDDGRTWRTTRLPNRDNADVGEVAAFSADVAWRTGPNAGLLGTRDGGRTWQAVPGLTTRAYALTFAGDKHGWVLAGNALWRTTDGRTWERLG